MKKIRGDNNDTVNATDKGNPIQKMIAGTIGNNLLGRIHLESVVINGKPTFLVAHNNDGEIHIIPNDKIQDKNGVTYEPCRPNEYPYQPYEFTMDELSSLNQVDRKAILKDVHDEFDTFVDMPDDLKILATIATVFSYLQDKSQTAPYVSVIGEPESGKSRLLELVTYIAYRPMHGSSIPAADVFTYLGKHGEGMGTICIDECEGIIKDRQLIKILKEGYRKGSIVPRIDLNNGRKQEFFHTYGLKFLAGEHMPEDKALQERCISIEMTLGNPTRDDITDADKVRFMQVRKRLLLLKMCTRFEDLPYVDTELKNRTKELWKPLIQVASGTDYEQTLKIMASLAQQKKVENRRNSLEGEIVQIVIRLHNNNGGKPLPFLDIWEELLPLGEEMDNETVYIEAYGKISKNRVGRILQNVLHGNPSLDMVNGHKKRIYRFDKVQLQKIAERYGLKETMEMLETI